MGKRVLLACGLGLCLAACKPKSKLDDLLRKKDAGVTLSGTRSFDFSVPVWDEPVADLPKQESFTLLDPGKGDRSVLRYQLSPVATAHRAETRLTSRHLAQRAWSDKAQLPAIRDGFAITVSDPKQPLAVRPLKAEVEAGPNGTTAGADEYLKTWRALENRRFSMAVDARGQLGAITFGDDPGGARSAEAKDELVQRMLVTLVPLPEEPVGVGARWRVVTALRQRPAVVKQTATYTLTARTAGSWKIDVEISRVAEPQDLRDPALPPGIVANLVALLRRYQGTLEVDPHRVLPTGTLSVDSTIHIRLSGGANDEQIFEDAGTIKLSNDL